MKKGIFVSLLLVFLVYAANARTVRDAEKFFNIKQYQEAYNIYDSLLNIKNEALIHFKAGRCQIELKNWKVAEKHFDIALQRKYNKSYLYYGLIYFNQYRFDKALSSYSMYKDKRSNLFSEQDFHLLDSLVNLAETGQAMLNRVEDIAIVDSVKVSKDNLFRAYRLDKELGSIAYIGDSDAAHFITGRSDRRIFAKKNDESQSYDLRISYKLIDGWSPASLLSQNLSSNLDENFPFVLPDGITIYFASKGHQSLGGYDIFFSRYSDALQDYTEPQNIGMPFNSTANDYMLVIDEINELAWFATDRNQHKDSVVIYEFVPNTKRTILTTINQDSLILAAQLKLFRTVERSTKFDSKVSKIENKHDVSSVINFHVNDNIVYTSLDQFKSEEAKELYLQLLEFEVTIEEEMYKLDEKRKEYFHIKDTEKGQIIYNEVLKIEEEIHLYKQLYEEYNLKIRNAEIAEINKK